MLDDAIEQESTSQDTIMKATTVAVATEIPTVAPLVTGPTVPVGGEKCSIKHTTLHYYGILPCTTVNKLKAGQNE